MYNNVSYIVDLVKEGGRDGVMIRLPIINTKKVTDFKVLGCPPLVFPTFLHIFS